MRSAPLALLAVLLAAPVVLGAPTDLRGVLADAIRRGAPLFNRGERLACARLYAETARGLLAADPPLLGELQRPGLAAALATEGDATARAWALRRAFDEIVADLDFEPLMEAELPAGFPPPGPVHHVVEKRYPRYRAARAAGGGSFWTLFRHIQRRGVSMTAPVEMRMDEDLRTEDMAFLYGRPDLGTAGADGSVEVVDLEPETVLSVALRGARTRERIQAAKEAIEARMAAEGLVAAGEVRVLAYNSPMVRTARQLYEVQIPVAPASGVEGAPEAGAAATPAGAAPTAGTPSAGAAAR